MNWEIWTAIGIVAWFVVAVVLALSISEILCWAGRAPALSCAVCGGRGRELGPDGACLDAAACVTDYDAALKTHTCGPDCSPD